MRIPVNQTHQKEICKLTVAMVGVALRGLRSQSGGRSKGLILEFLKGGTFDFKSSK